MGRAGGQSGGGSVLPPPPPLGTMEGGSRLLSFPCLPILLGSRSVVREGRVERQNGMGTVGDRVWLNKEEVVSKGKGGLVIFLT